MSAYFIYLSYNKRVNIQGKAIVQKTNFRRFVQEIRKEVPQDHFSDEALKLIFDDIKDEYEVKDIWDTFVEMPFNEFIWHHDYLLPKKEAVKKFISIYSRFLGFTSDKSAVYIDF